MPLGVKLGLNDVQHATDQLWKDKCVNVQAGIAAFYHGHIEHVANQAEKMLSGGSDLAGMFPHFARLVGIARQ